MSSLTAGRKAVPACLREFHHAAFRIRLQRIGDHGPEVRDQTADSQANVAVRRNACDFAAVVTRQWENPSEIRFLPLFDPAFVSQNRGIAFGRRS